MAAAGGGGGGGGAAQLDAQIAQININVQLLQNQVQQLQPLPGAVQQLQPLPGAVQQVQNQVQQLQHQVQQLQNQVGMLVPAGGAGPAPVVVLPPDFAGLAAAVAALAGVPAAVAALQAALAPPAAAGAAAGATVAAAAAAPGVPQLTVRQRISAARSANHHERDDVFVPVVRIDGTQPPHWPHNFSRRDLADMTPAAAQDLLGDYNLSLNGGPWMLRNRIAKHIGAISF
jgi:hypothetical protein